jgi:hypothetical protein
VSRDDGERGSGWDECGAFSVGFAIDSSAYVYHRAVLPKMVFYAEMISLKEAHLIQKPTSYK